MTTESTAAFSEKTQILIYAFGVLQTIILAYLGYLQKKNTTITSQTNDAVTETKGAIAETKASVDVVSANVAEQTSGLQHLVRATAAAEAARRIGSDQPPLMAAAMVANARDEITALEKRIAELRVREAEDELKQKADQAFAKLEKEAGLRDRS